MAKCAICKGDVVTGLVVDAECLKDMVKVVRCGVCRFYGERERYCYAMKKGGRGIKDYCSYGKRKRGFMR